MDQGARNWMLKYARKNHWRVASWMDLDDLVQEGYAAYYETRKRYPTAIEPKHIMSLFALVFRSKIEMLVLAKRKQIDTPAQYEENQQYGITGLSEDLSWPGISGKRPDLPSPNEPIQVDSFDFQLLLMRAPKMIKDALSLFTTDEGRQELAKPYEVREDGSRETTNDRFCRLLGIDSDTIDLTKEMRMYFQA